MDRSTVNEAQRKLLLSRTLVAASLALWNQEEGQHSFDVFLELILNELTTIDSILEKLIS
jgi:hypothetical protein